MVAMVRATGILSCVILSGCLTYQSAQSSQPVYLSVALNQADAECVARNWPTMLAKMQCFDFKEESIWLTYVPAYQRFFEVIREKRDALAAQYDAGQITLDQFNVQFSEYGRAVIAQMRQQIIIDNAANAQAQQGADNLSQALAAGIVAYSETRAAQAASTQHTTCQVLLGQLQCTTTTY